MDLNATIKVTADARLDGLRQAAQELKLVKDRTLAMEQAQDLLTRSVIGTDAALNAHIKRLEAARLNVDRNSKEYRQLGDAIDQYKAKLAGADVVAAKSSGGLGGLAGAAGLASRAFGAIGAGLALADLGRLGITAESAAAKLRTLKGAIPDFDKLQPLIEQVNKETGGLAGSAELSAAAYEILSAGATSAADAAAKLKAALTLAQGGAVETAVAVDGLTSITNAYGVSADRVGEVADKIRKTVDDGKISFEEYSQQIGKAAAVAAASGVSLDELNAAIAAVTVGGIRAESAVSGVRQLIINIIKPTKEASDLAEALGINLSGAALKSKGLAGVLKEIQEKTGGNSQTIAKLITDVDGLTAAQALLRGEGEQLNKFIDNQANSYGTASKAANELANTSEASIKRLKAAWEGFGERLVKIFGPVFSYLLDGFSRVIDAASSAASGAQNFFRNNPTIGGLVRPGIAAIAPVTTPFLAGLQTVFGTPGGGAKPAAPAAPKAPYKPVLTPTGSGSGVDAKALQDAADAQKQAAKDAATEQKRQQDEALRQQLDNQKRAFSDQQALDKQLFDDRQRREKQVYDQKLELLRLSNDKELLGLTGLAAQVAKFFQGIKLRRLQDEKEIFELQQQNQQKLFESQQKNAREAFEQQAAASKGSIKGGDVGIKQLVQLAQGAGFSGQSAAILAAIAKAESGGRSRALNDNPKTGDLSYGLWQINMLGAMGPERRRALGIASNDALYDPMTNAMAARAIFQSQGFGAWSVYRNGAYKDYLPAAMAALSGGGPANTIVPMKPFPGGVQAGSAAAAGAANAGQNITELRKFQQLRESLQRDIEFGQITQASKESARALQEEAAGLKLRAELVQRGFSSEEADRIATQQERFNKLTRAGRDALEQFDQGVQDNVRSLKASGASQQDINTFLAEQAVRRRELADAIDGERTALQDLYDAQEASKEQTRSFSDGARDAFREYADAALNAADSAKGFVTSSISKTEDALVDFVTKGKLEFSSLVDSILADLARLAIRQAILGPIAQLLGLGGGGFGTTSFGSFDLLGGILNGTGGLFANGGIMTDRGPLPLQAYSSGGIANSPQLALFGEGRMPEAYVPLPDGRRIPVAMQGGGGGTSVTVNVDAKGTAVEGNDDQGRALGAVIAAAVQAELVKQRRPGGALARA